MMKNDTLREDELLALLGIARLLREQPYTITNHAFEEHKKLCNIKSCALSKKIKGTKRY